jgi:hypothetical protein
MPKEDGLYFALYSYVKTHKLIHINLSPTRRLLGFHPFTVSV